MSASHAYTRWNNEGDDLERRLEDIEGHLLDDIDDERLQSSVPPDFHASDLAFVGLTGLTRSVPSSAEPVAKPVPEELDPTKPVSFYEPGVDDVDASATQGIDVAENDLQDIAAEQPSSSLNNLKEILADLARAENEVAPLTQPLESESARGNGHHDAEPPDADADTSVPEPDAAVEAAFGFDSADETGFDAAEDETTDAAAIGANAIEAGHGIVDESWLADALDYDVPPADAAAVPGPSGSEVAGPEVDASCYIEQPQAAMAPADIETEQAQSAVSLDDIEFEDTRHDPRSGSGPEPLEMPSRPAGGTADEDAPDLGLDEFQAYLEELEQQPRATASDGDARGEEAGESELGVLEAADGPGLEAVYRRPRPQRPARRSKKGNKLKRQLIRWAVRAAILTAVGIAGYVGYGVFQDLTASPDWLIEQAAGLSRDGEHLEAAEAYQRFARRFPAHDRRAEAQFEAALNLYLAQDTSLGAKHTLDARALEQLEQFLAEFPGSPRAARAQNLMGIIQFRLGNYEQAVSLLSASELRVKDPVAALPALRILAQAHVKLDDFAAAESAYRQAASMIGNVTADRDYAALGDMYLLRAEQAQSGGESRRYLEQAIGAWDHALALASIDPDTRAAVMAKRDAVAAQLASSVPQTEEVGNSEDTSAPAPQPAGDGFVPTDDTPSPPQG